MLVTLAALAGAYAITIVSAVFYKRSFNKLSEKSGVRNFGTAGELILIGTALTIILIGGLIAWIGWIFGAIGFNSMKPKTNAPPNMFYPSNNPVASFPDGEKKFCSYCGQPMSLDSAFCPNCGKPAK